MKFGETLYQRSVPQWAAYNVKYNELKHLIKLRTSAGSSLPIAIPTAGTSRWQDLENELHAIIKKEYQDVSLFLRTKQGEIDRRLAYLDKQVTAALRAVATASSSRPVTQARRYQKLVKDGDAIGDDIESLSRFAAVQKAAFRKILKKYRKWTGSTALQERLDKDVFSSGALQVDYAEYLQRLSKATTIISSQLQMPMLTGHDSPQRRGRHGRALSQSNAKAISDLCARGPLYFDAALDEMHYGESGGTAHFWIHPEYLEQVEALLLRHLSAQDPRPSSRQSPSSSTSDLTSSLSSVTGETHQIVLDNVQRFLRDDSTVKPSRAAVIARWDTGSNAVLTLASLNRKSDSTSTVTVKRKRIPSLLYRSHALEEHATAHTKDAEKVKDYLSEHRDVKPLAAIHSHRSRFSGMNNTKDIGTWAILDHSIRFDNAHEAKLDSANNQAEAGDAFPHAVLHVRWEFSRLPELVRVLEASHLVERVRDFSMERAAVFTANKELGQPPWHALLDVDIRRVPALLTKKPSPGATRREIKPVTVSGSSGPSSAGGDSVFSATQAQSSATEPELGPESSTCADSPTLDEKPEPTKKFRLKNSRKDKVRVLSPPPPEPQPQRYWNEFDDGDSDVHDEERFAIYVDPNEETFPGAEAFSKAFGGMYDSLRQGKDRVVSWWPMGASDKANDGERTPLLFGPPSRKGSNDASVESSGSDTDDILGPPQRRQKRNGMFRQLYARGRPLSRKQKALEQTLFQFYTGLIILAYLLLAMAGILLGTGRKKRRLEVDAGVVTGVVAAEACIGTSIVLVCMRRQSLDPVHWGLVAVNVAVVVVVGVAELALMLGNIRG